MGESHISNTIATPQAWLPFMESTHKKGDRAHLLKRCCLRVKCFIGRVVAFIVSHHIFVFQVTRNKLGVKRFCNCFGCRD